MLPERFSSKSAFIIAQEYLNYLSAYIWSSSIASVTTWCCVGSCESFPCESFP